MKVEELKEGGGIEKEMGLDLKRETDQGAVVDGVQRKKREQEAEVEAEEWGRERERERE